MFCKHCGSQIADDAIFCSHCGTRLVDEVPAAPAAQVAAVEPAVQAMTMEPQTQDMNVAPPAQGVPAPAQGVPAVSAESAAQAEPEAARKPFLEGMEWNVSEYPDSNTNIQTEDIDFDWGLDPEDVPETRTRPEEPVEPVTVSAPKTPEAESVSQVFDRVVPVEEAKASIPVKEALEAANKVEEVGQFNTFNRKNAEFQQLLDKEYEKVRGGRTIGDEQIHADEVAAQKYDSIQKDVDMDSFLQKEGVVKLYEPKALESDVLDRIDALEKQRAQKEAEEAARIKALEEARLEALKRKREEESRANAQIEAAAAAEAEIREAEEAEALRLKMEEDRRKAAEEAAKLEAIAQRKAEEEARIQEEMRLREAEEARIAAEERARAKAEEEARIKADAQARAAAEEEARLKAEAELKAAREEARIRAEKEAALAAREEAEFKAAQLRKQREEEIARLKRESEERQIARAEESAIVEDEVRKALEQTAKMRKEEEDKIKAALAGIRGGRFSDTLSATEKDLPDEKPQIKDVMQAESRKTPSDPEELTLENIGNEMKAFDVSEQKPDASRDTVFADREKIEEAHRHTRYNIEAMSKAREDFFADLPGGDPEADRKPATGVESSHENLVSPLTRTVDKEAIAAGMTSTKKLTREALDIGQALGIDTGVAMPASVTDDTTEFAKDIQDAEIPPISTETAQEAAPSGSDAEELLNQFESVMASGSEEQPAVPEMPAVEPVEALTAEPAAPAVPEMPAVEPFTPEMPAVEPVEELTAEPAAPAVPEVPAVEPFTPEMPEVEPVEELTAEPAAPVIPEMPAVEPVEALTAEPAAPAAPEVPAVEPFTPEMPMAEPDVSVQSSEELYPQEAPVEIPVDEVASEIPSVDVIPQAAQEVPEAKPYDPALEALKAEKPGLEDTMVMPQINRIDEFSKSDFANYGKAEAEELMRLKEAAVKQEAEAQEKTAAAAAEIATTGVSTGEAYDILEQIEHDAQQIQQETERVAEDEPVLTAKELKKQERAKAKEAKKAAREKKKEDKKKKKEDTFGDEEKSEIIEAPQEGEEAAEKGGKGRLILMIILILLCIVFALELVGIGIKMFASTSPAAEFIDKILNNLIQMITGNNGGGTFIG